MSNIKDMQDVLSDFNSCNSTIGSSSSDEASASDASSTGIHNKKRKKKSKTLPGREAFLKKQSSQVSPK